MKRAVILGNEGYNLIGLLQSLGREGVHVISVLLEDKPETIYHSRYSGEIICAPDMDFAINVILERCVFDTLTPIFPAGDPAAMALEQNRKRLEAHFVFEHTQEEKGISFYMNKFNQYELAKKNQFNVPFSIHASKGIDAPDNMLYPCIVKPLVSCHGDKSEIIIANNQEQLSDILKRGLPYSKEVIIQQYLDKDYEYIMLGCSFRDGSVYIPLSGRKIRFNHYLKDVATVTIIEPIDKKITIEVEKIKRLMHEIGYVGLFSVEFMHNRLDDKIYFTEINLRNDGLNSFIVNCGVNLPYLHYLDLMNHSRKTYRPIDKPQKYISEGAHFSALMRHEISVGEWLRDLWGVKGFLLYFKDDKRPFIDLFLNFIMRRLKCFIKCN